MTDFRDNFDDDLENDLDDDFSSFRDDLFGDEEGSSSLLDDLPPLEEGMEDEIDQLRRKSARGGSLDDALDSDDEIFSGDSSSGSAFAWSSFTPGQRLILAILVLLNIVMGAVGLLVITGNLG